MRASVQRPVRRRRAGPAFLCEGRHLPSAVSRTITRRNAVHVQCGLIAA